MKLAISGKFSNEIIKDALSVLGDFKEAMLKANLSDVDANLHTFVYFPVILNDGLRISQKSHRSFSKKESAEFVNVEISYEAWARASRNRKIRLLFDGLLSAIDLTSEQKISRNAKVLIFDRLQACLDQS